MTRRGRGPHSFQGQASLCCWPLCSVKNAQGRRGASLSCRQPGQTHGLQAMPHNGSEKRGHTSASPRLAATPDAALPANVGSKPANVGPRGDGRSCRPSRLLQGLPVISGLRPLCSKTLLQSVSGALGQRRGRGPVSVFLEDRQRTRTVPPCRTSFRRYLLPRICCLPNWVHLTADGVDYLIATLILFLLFLFLKCHFPSF